MERNDVLKDIADTFKTSMNAAGGTTTAAYKGFKAGYDYATAEMGSNPVPPEPEEGATEQAFHCDELMWYIVVQTHLNWRSTVWGSNPVWRDRFLELGARFTRSQFGTSNPALTDLKYIKAKLINVMDPDDGSGNYDTVAAGKHLDFAASNAAQMAAFEGPNEPNHNNPPNWDDKLVEYQQFLFEEVNARPEIAKMPVVGPSMWGRETAAYNTLGTRLAAYTDAGNLHYYTNGQRPSIAGFPGSYDEGGDPDKTYTLDDAIREANIITPGKPLWITETGWGISGPNLPLSASFVTPRAQAKYNTRMLFEAYIRGVKRCSIYTLLDDVRTPPRYHGMMDQQMNKRPSFGALKNTIALINDPGEFTPGSLEMSINVPKPVVRMPLMQRQDGTFLLVLWQDVDSYNRQTFKDIEPAPINVTLELGESAKVRMFEPTFNIDPIREATGASISLPVKDHVLVVEITP